MCTKLKRNSENMNPESINQTLRIFLCVLVSHVSIYANSHDLKRHSTHVNPKERNGAMCIFPCFFPMLDLEELTIEKDRDRHEGSELNRLHQTAKHTLYHPNWCMGWSPLRTLTATSSETCAQLQEDNCAGKTKPKFKLFLCCVEKLERNYANLIPRSITNGAASWALFIDFHLFLYRFDNAA